MRRNTMGIDEFLSRYTVAVPESGCFLWVASCDTGGYAQLSRVIDGKERRPLAHRVAYELAYGPIPAGMHVCHKCDVRSCVAPAHLFLGDAKINRADCIAKRRHCYGERHHRAKLTNEQARRIQVEQRPLPEIMAEFGISKAQASAVRRGRFWKHVAV